MSNKGKMLIRLWITIFLINIPLLIYCIKGNKKADLWIKMPKIGGYPQHFHKMWIYG